MADAAVDAMVRALNGVRRSIACERDAIHTCKQQILDAQHNIDCLQVDEARLEWGIITMNNTRTNA